MLVVAIAAVKCEDKKRPPRPAGEPKARTMPSGSLKKYTKKENCPAVKPVFTGPNAEKFTKPCTEAGFKKGGCEVYTFGKMCCNFGTAATPDYQCVVPRAEGSSKIAATPSATGTTASAVAAPAGAAVAATTAAAPSMPAA